MPGYMPLCPAMKHTVSIATAGTVRPEICARGAGMYDAAAAAPGICTHMHMAQFSRIMTFVVTAAGMILPLPKKTGKLTC